MKDYKNCAYPLGKVTFVSFLTAIHFSCCVNDKLRVHDPTSSTNTESLEAITKGLSKLAEKQKQAMQTEVSSTAQSDFIKAIKSGNLEAVHRLIQENDLLDLNKGGVFIPQAHYNKVESVIYSIEKQKADNLNTDGRLANCLNENPPLGKKITAGEFDFIGYDCKEISITSLVLAAKCKHKAIFDFLINCQGIDIETSDPETGSSPLHLAIERGWNDSANSLIEQLSLSNLSMEDGHGNTAIHCAIKYCNLTLVKSLLDKIALSDLSIPNQEKIKPLQTAIKLCRFDIVKELLNELPSNEIIDGLKFAFEDRDIESIRRKSRKDKSTLVRIVKALLTEGKLELNHLAIEDQPYGTPLHLAIKSGDKDAIELLLTKSPREGFLFQDEEGKTALHLAIESNLEQTAYDLIKKLYSKAFLLEDKNGLTPLEATIKNDCIETFKLLLGKITLESLLTKKNKLVTILELIVKKKENKKFKLFFDAVADHPDFKNPLIVDRLFSNKNYNCFISAIIFDEETTAKKIVNFGKKAKKFDYVVKKLSDHLTANDYSHIVQEINNLESCGKLSKQSARFYRSMVPLQTASLLEHGNTVMPYKATEEQKEFENEAKDLSQFYESSIESSENGYVSGSVASSSETSN